MQFSLKYLYNRLLLSHVRLTNNKEPKMIFNSTNYCVKTPLNIFNLTPLEYIQQARLPQWSGGESL